MKKSSQKTAAHTIRSTADFARYVGLSRSAVSRVLNNQPGLRDKTIERVRRAMEETGFTVNAHALHLRGRSTAMIGVCIEDLLTPTAVSKLAVLQEVLRARNYTALIEVLKPGTGRKVLQHFLALRVDAIIFIGQFDPPELENSIAALNRRGLPHLVIDHPGLTRANTLTLDRAGAMREITTRLLDLGHRRFGLLGITGPFQTITDRLRGIREALAQRGLDFATCVQTHDERIRAGDHFAYGSELARLFAREPSRPTAFLAVNDETAIGAMLEFQALGLRIPEDLSVAGFNNQNICLMSRPQLTSVDQKIDTSITTATDLILEQIGRPLATKPILRFIEPLLVERGSTGPVTKSARRSTKP